MSTTKIKVNKNWKFHLGNEAEAWYKGFDDSDWEDVILPHDWSVTLPFSKDNSSGTAYLAGGTAWYRGRFSYSGIESGKRVKLVFDGVYKNAKVWINSYYLGPHAYGYTPFEFDITDFLSPDYDNEISVSVNHEDISDSRWYPGSGYINFEEILEALDQIGYEGYLSVECFPHDDNINTASKALGYMKKLDETMI